MDINYDEIPFSEKVSEILQQDFFLMEKIHAEMMRTIKNPIKFSAYTSVFLTRGTAVVDINLIRYEVTAPAIINIPADRIVMPVRISDDAEASFMVFSKNLIDSVSTTVKDLSIFSLTGTHSVIHISQNDLSAFHRYYSDMRRILNDPANHYKYQSFLFTTVAFFYNSVVKYYEHLSITRIETTQNRIADRFIRLVQQHYRQQRFLEFYADEMEITPKHLSRTIKAQTGMSPVEWINRHVILEAKVMLRSSSLNIQQIANELHFPSQSFFGKYFKKATGLSPKEYRVSILGHKE